MDSFDVVILSVIAIVGFAAVSSNIKEKMEEKGKKIGKRKGTTKKYYFMYSYLYNDNHSFTDIIMEDGFSKTRDGSSGGSFYSN